jgi:hypothetical protein
MPLTSVWLANRTVPCSTTKKNGGWKSYDQLAFINYLGTRAMMLKPCGTQGIKSGTGGKTHGIAEISPSSSNRKRNKYGYGYQTIPEGKEECLRDDLEWCDSPEDDKQIILICKKLEAIEHNKKHNADVAHKRARFNEKKRMYAKNAKINRERQARHAVVQEPSLIDIEIDSNSLFDKESRKQKYDKNLKQKRVSRMRDYQHWFSEIQELGIDYKPPALDFIPKDLKVPVQPKQRYADENIRDCEQANPLTDWFFVQKEMLNTSSYGIRMDDCQVKSLETILLLITNLAQTTTWTHFCTTLLAYVHSNFDISFTKILTVLVEEQLREMTRVQNCGHDESWTRDSEQGAAEYVHKTATTLLKGWNIVAHGETAAKLKKLVAMLVAGGACFLTKMPFTGELFTRFYQSSGVDKVTGADMISQVLETAIFFWERGMAFFATGDVRALFSSHTLVDEYDIEFAFLSARINFIKNGDIKNAGMTEVEYQERVEKLYQRGVDFLRVYKGPERKVLTDKLYRTEVLRAEMLDAMNRINIKEQPFSVLIYGNSGEGKSTISSLITSDCLRAMGYPCKKENICSLNPADKFQTEYRPEHHGLKLDDLGNVISEFVDASPLEVLRKVINNEPCFALKADVGEKGKILFRPKAVVVTTNIKNLDAHVYSREPISAMRRFNYILTMSIRDEYRNDNLMGLNFSKTKKILGDFWTFKVEVAKPLRVNPEMLDRSNQPVDGIGYDVVEHEGKKLQSISLEELLKFLRLKSQSHLQRQIELVDVLRALDEQEDCPHGMYTQLCSECQVQVGEQADFTFEFIAKAYHSIPKWVRRSLFCVPEWLELWPAKLYEQMLMKPIKSFVRYTCVSAVVSLYISLCCCVASSHIMPLSGAYLLSVTCFLLSTIVLMKVRFSKMVNDIKDAPFKFICGEVKSSMYTGVFAVMAGTMAVVYALYRVYRTCSMVQTTMQMQSSEMKIPDKDEKKRVNVWKKVHVSNPEVDARVCTATLDQMVKLVSGKTAHITYHDNERGVRCNAFPLGRNCWMAPYHILKKGYTHMRFVLVDPNKIGPNFTARIDESLVYKIPGKDMCVFYVPAGGSQADLTHLFPESVTTRPIGVTSVYKNAEGEVVLDKFRATPSMRVHEDDDPRIMTYKMTNQTFPGLCTTPLLAMGKVPYVVGFHVGGNELIEGREHTAHTLEECKRGYALMLTRKEVVSAIEHLYDSCPMALRVASSGTMRLDSVDHNIALKGYVHDKSPLNFMEQGDLTCWGAHTGQRRRITSRCVKSCISDAVTAEMGSPNIWSGPKNIGNSRPWHAELDCYMSQQDVNPKYANMAYVDLSTSLSEFLKNHPNLKEKVHPIPTEVAIAGATECYGCDSMNMNTSTGWPMNKCKKDVLNFDLPPHERIGRPAALPANLQQEVEECIASLRSGVRTYNVFRGNLKDEPTKVDKEKVRVFTGSPIVLTVIMRMYFLMISKFIMENPVAFECAVGLNCHGPEWNELVKHFTQHGFDRIIAGDFKAFDSMVCAMMTIMAFKICILVAVWAGFSPEDISLMESIATEVVYAIIEMHGDFVSPNGSNPSGHMLTVIINCIVGALYFRCAFYEEADRLGITNLPVFNTVVALATYGDDNVMSVKSGYDWYNHTSIQRVLGTYGVQYTMADKTSESKPFITIEETEFLKRTPVYNEELHVWWAPLHEQSIVKSLHCNIASEVLSPGEHAAECIEGAMSEYFFHGQEVYEDRAQKLQRVAAQCGIEPHLDDGVFQPYRCRMQKYVEKYGVTDKEQADPYVIDQNEQYYYDDAEETAEWMMAHAAHTGQIARQNELWLEQYQNYHELHFERLIAYRSRDSQWFRNRGEEYPFEWDFDLHYSDVDSDSDSDDESITDDDTDYDTDDEERSLRRRRGMATRIMELAGQQWDHMWAEQAARELAFWKGAFSVVVRELSRVQERSNAIQTARSTPAESLNVPARSRLRSTRLFGGLSRLLTLFLLTMCFTSTVSYTHPVIRTVSEYDWIATTQETYRMDATSGAQKHQNLVFRDGEENWTVAIPSSMDATRMVGMQEDVTLGEFMARPVQIAAYQWVIGTPFNVVFNPWALFFNQRRVNNRINNFNLMQSKLKIKVIVNGTPFHFGRLMLEYAPLLFANYIDDFTFTEPNLVQASQRMHLTFDPCESQGGEMELPFLWPYNSLNVQQADWEAMGLLYFREIVGLAHANNGTTAVSVSVYAWAEDIKLSIPTTQNNIRIVGQGDEYGTKPISSIATAVSKAAGNLTKIPMIGGYARATEMIAGSMGKVAKAYGYSRPAVIDEASDMMPKYYSRLANTDVGDNTDKLTVDSKQELTVDPAVTGADTGDELTVANIATKQSYITQFAWAIASVPGTLLWNTQVGPMYLRNQPLGTYSIPAMTFAALPFMWWRGTIRYRFQIVASAYHRGRIKIVYDPNQVDSQDANIAYTRIVDLANERDFTIDVAWGQNKTFLRTAPIDPTFANAFGPTIPVVKDTVFKNGILSIYVLNDLVAPTDTGNTINIITYCSFVDDVEFAVPANGNISQLTYQNQGDEFDIANAPLDLGAKECVAACIEPDKTMLVYYGESVPSFRTLLKRYNRQASFLYPVTTQANWQIVQPDFPPSPGVCLSGLNATATVPSVGAKVNFTNMTMLNYLAPAFLMMRGGMRVKYAFSNTTTRTITNAELARLDNRELNAPEGQANAVGPVIASTPSTFAEARLTGNSTSGLQGFTITYVEGQPILSAELPYYSNRRFDGAKNPGFIQSTTTPSGTHQVRLIMPATPLAFVDKYVSVAEDFNLVLFQGAPRLRYRNFT